MLKRHPEILTPQGLYQQMMAVRRGDPIEDSLARMLSSWIFGDGVLPNYMGLNPFEFNAMLAHHFPNYKIEKKLKFDSADLNSAVEDVRNDESQELRQLLLENRTHNSHSEIWMVDIVVAGCMGNDHLWQDLGLWSRADLSQLMLENFKPLAVRNNKNMKWKKFLYKQLCEAEGIYICRSPSCETCAEYSICFAPVD